MFLKLTGIQNYKNISLEDVAQMIFSKTILDNLQQKCAPSVWCLSQQKDILHDREEKEYLKLCDLDCMLDISDECLNKVSGS